MCFTRPSGCCEAPSVTDAKLHPSMRTLPSLLSASASAKSAQEDPTDTCMRRFLMPCSPVQVLPEVSLKQEEMQGKICTKAESRATPGCLRQTSAEVLSA